MPLVWAHAEYLKLRRSLRDGRLFDLPPQTVQRYLKEKTASPRLVWRFNHKIRSLPAGKMLRVETWRLPSFTGVPTIGKQARTQRRTMWGWGFTSSI